MLQPRLLELFRRREQAPERIRCHQKSAWERAPVASREVVKEVLRWVRRPPPPPERPRVAQPAPVSALAAPCEAQGADRRPDTESNSASRISSSRWAVSSSRLLASHRRRNCRRVTRSSPSALAKGLSRDSPHSGQLFSRTVQSVAAPVAAIARLRIFESNLAGEPGQRHPNAVAHHGDCG